LLSKGIYYGSPGSKQGLVMWDLWWTKGPAGFLEVLGFPLQIFIPPISPQSPSPVIRGWYNRPVVAAVPKVPPQKKKWMNDCRHMVMINWLKER
jgi:hypothetical protein